MCPVFYDQFSKPPIDTPLPDPAPAYGAGLAKVEKIETALEPHFQQLFVHAMAMPNKVDAFPNLAKAVALPERKVLELSADGSSGRRGGSR